MDNKTNDKKTLRERFWFVKDYLNPQTQKYIRKAMGYNQMDNIEEKQIAELKKEMEDREQSFEVFILGRILAIEKRINELDWYIQRTDREFQECRNKHNRLREVTKDGKK